MIGAVQLACLAVMSAARVQDLAPQDGVRFGMAVATLDDLDGDDVPEIAVGAPCWIPATEALVRSHRGLVLILSGVDRSVLRSIRGDPALEGFGEALESVPDADGDGKADLVVLHASWKDAAGRVRWLVSSSTGERLREIGPDVVRDANAGDRDGDGRADSWVARVSDGLGEVALHSSRDGSVLMEIPVPETLARADFGRAILALPDLDGDAVLDVVITAPDDPFGSIVRAYSGSRGALLWESRRNGDEIGRVGVSLASYPDRDADGVPEVLVGSCDYLWHGAIFREGSVRLLSGKSGSTIWIHEEQAVPDLGVR